MKPNKKELKEATDIIRKNSECFLIGANFGNGELLVVVEGRSEEVLALTLNIIAHLAQKHPEPEKVLAITERVIKDIRERTLEPLFEEVVYEAKED